MDKVTLKVMSHSCTMADITDQGISCKYQNIRITPNLLDVSFLNDASLVDFLKFYSGACNVFGCLSSSNIRC